MVDNHLSKRVTSFSDPAEFTIKRQTGIWISISVVFIISLLDIAGWIFGIPYLTSIEPHWITMKVITAVCFLLATISVIFIWSGSHSGFMTVLTRVLISIFTFISLLTIISYLFILVSGHEPGIAGYPLLKIILLPSYRMPFLTCSIFTIFGCILLLLSVRNKLADDIAHILVIPAAMASAFLPVMYMLNIYSTYEMPYMPGSLNSGLAFCGLLAAVILIRPHTWIMKVLLSKSPGGIMARKILPGLIILPMVIGWLRIFELHSGLFRFEIGVAIMTISYILAFILLLWFTARSVNRVDEERIIFEDALLKANQEMGVINKKLNEEIIAHRQAEETLKKHQSHLNDLISTKDKFFSIVAHDLKNPFTSLLGPTELLIDNIERLEREEIIKLASVINDSAKGGYAILQNLLDWSRSQTGILQINPQKINLRKLIDENIANIKLYAANKDIKVSVEVDKSIDIVSDINMLNTVVRNLLSNAVKFSYRGGRVTVSSVTTTYDVTVSVEDNGIGISEENIEKLFRIDTKFQSPGTDKEQGTGLGLKLCKEFVTKLGGEIWVESIEKKGSKFKFTLPQTTHLQN